MRPRITVGWVMMLAALLWSLVPATTLTASPAEAASVCDWAQFVSDVTVPDGTNVAPGLTFTKTWRLKNIGTCTWATSYSLVFSSGNQLGGASSVPFPNSVAPGHTLDISVTLTAPSAPGHYVGFWQFKNAAGALFGIGSTTKKVWWVDINVLAPTTFGVVYDFASNYCSASWNSAAGSLPCPGTDEDARGSVLRVENPQLENGTVSADSGLILMPQAAFDGDIHGIFPAFRVQSGDRFRSIVNCASGATGCFVTFRLEYQIGNGAINTLWSLREKYDGGIFRTDLDLSALAGQDVKFILTVLATGSADGDRALWVNPVIVRSGGGPPPTETPAPSTPTPTPVPAATCERAQFIADVTVPDGTIYAPGTAFTKTWRLKNIGTCTWTTAFSMVFESGEQMSGPGSVPLPKAVAPAETIDLLVNLTAPSAAGTYRGYWRLQDPSGGRFGIGTGGTKSWWVEIRVSGGPVNPPGCNRAQFVSDVTIPDGAVLAPGAAFTKTWRLRNIGTCAWTTTYAMVFTSGERMGGVNSVSMPSSVAPGSSVDVSVSLTAPLNAGRYRGYWAFQNAEGARFGVGSDGSKSWWVDIRVSGTPATPTPTTTPATATPVPGLIVRGYVRLADGSGLPGVSIYRSFAAYDGVIVATTDANGYFQSDFAFIPGDEMVRVWPSAAGYSFDPESAYWRHYYGPEDRTFNFVASPASGIPTATPGVTATPTASPTATPTQTPTSTSTPTPTASPSNGWSTYQNSAYGFSFQFPPGSSVSGQSDTGGHIDLPIKPGTNLVRKSLDVNVAEGVTPCKSPGMKPPNPTENVTFNGIQFLKETWAEGVTSHRADLTAYSTAKGNACISMTFLLWSVVPEVMETPPPVFDYAAESAVFTTIMSSFTEH